MNKERIQQLNSFIESSEDDPFLYHALGLEYKGTDSSLAKSNFQKALSIDEKYVGTYYHLAEVLIDLEELEEAKSVYEKGIEMTSQLNDEHTLRELKNAFQNFLFEYDL